MDEEHERRGPWRIRQRSLRYENPWITVTEHDVITPGGGDGIYGVVSFKNLAIGVLPIFDDGSVVLVGQYRFALKEYSWELPEGGGPLGVDPEESARRELREETGLTAAHWTPMLEMHLSNSVTDERSVCFLATGLTEGDADPEPTEALTLRRAPFGEALGEALDGRITDALTVAMLLRGWHMAQTGGMDPKLSDAIRRTLAVGPRVATGAASP